ncbi:DUF2587 domain-containing protein [Paenarthrobacter sp. DKR-5]|uniref:bacterial proteasome activator family protein n=1 Tax=Paenarthrobacter sp. DKR-5 TaxID=2835535 RepID=UPI001BDC5934|nr:bacterial proteasome activator family protein [Paenarthrobacter sp. DKR-5]MBT1003597.1 DUF2587 domain-containing protein [Paenarthrobacter sp. DKR-5]
MSEQDETVTEGRVTDGHADGPEHRIEQHQGGEPPQLQELVDQPAKVMRIGTMVRQLLEEVRNSPLDEAARTRLAEIHERSIRELEDGLAPELVEELHRIHLPFTEAQIPSDAELRIAQAQLVGWLEGLFHGIQTALAAQQISLQHAAAQRQFRELPPGTVIAPGIVIGENGQPRRAAPGREGKQPPGEATGPGQYL